MGKWDPKFETNWHFYFLNGPYQEKSNYNTAFLVKQRFLIDKSEHFLFPCLPV